MSVEALYAFGALVDNVYGQRRQMLLAESASELTSSLGVPQADVRAAAVRVITTVIRLACRRRCSRSTVGDAVVVALNDKGSGIRMAAIGAVGVLRYERGLQAVADIFQHYERGTIAAAALGSLAQIAHRSSLPLFVAALVGT